MAKLEENEAIEIMLDGDWPQKPFYRTAMKHGYARMEEVNTWEMTKIRKQIESQKDERIAEVVDRYKT